MRYLENENLKDLVNEGVHVVDFYADWCGPCKMLSPVLEELDTDVIKVNVDAHSELAREYGVMSIPAVFFFKDGEVKEKHIGFTDKETLQEILDNIK